MWHIPGKTNIKADILSRKNQVNTWNNKKDVQILKEELWIRRQMTVEVILLQRNKVVEETALLKEIWQNVYVNGRIYIPNNRKIQEQVLWENHDLIDIGHLEQ